MATVTTYTKAKIDQVLNATVATAAVVGDDLILTKVGGAQVNAGNVRGPQGIQGVQGPAGPSNPTGTFIMGGWSTDPSGYLILDGRTIVGGVATYGDLATMFPSWVSGGNLILPNASGAVPMGGATPGVVSGSMSKTILTTNLPSHQHAIAQHQHSGPSHQHTFSTNAVSALGFDVVRRFASYGTGGDYGVPWDSNGDGVTNTQPTGPQSAGTAHYHDFANTAVMSVGNGGNPSHSHSGSTSFDGTGVTGMGGPTNTDYTGSGTAFDVTPKNITVKYAVKT